MEYKNLISQSVYNVISKNFEILDLPPEKIESLIEVPKDSSLGDLAFPCFLLSKPLRKPPQKISSELEGWVSEKLDIERFESVSAAGPYLNFKIKKSHLAATLIPQILNESFVQPQFDQTDKVMVEFSQPNTHKEFHVGHMRNVALGDSLVRLFKWAGFKVTPVNYIGDVGTHIAKCLWYYRDYFKGETPNSNLGEFLGSLYVKANDMLDFSTLTYFPLTTVKLAQVKEVTPHQSNEKWRVVKIYDNESEKTVVCGGDDFQVGDFVAHLPIGSKWKGRDIGVNDMGGIPSEGMLLGYSELGLKGKSKKQIFTSRTLLDVIDGSNLKEKIQDIQPGDYLANVFSKEHNSQVKDTVVEEITYRENSISNILKDLEAGEPKITALWKKTRQWSLDEFDRIYDWLDVQFEHFYYESDVADEGKHMVQEALDKGILIRSEGAVGADLTDHKLPFFLLLKSDGTGLYSTKDLALAKDKFENFKIDRSIYVVDSSQSLHFQQVFKTLELIGFKQAQKCYHLAYGMVEGPEGKMSSRKGNVILFSKLKNILTNKIKEDFLNKYIDVWPQDEIEDTAKKIAVSTIKYGMLNQDNNKNIVFDMNEWTARTGNTGPYLMYAYARIQSILRDAGSTPNANDKVHWEVLTHEREESLLTHLMRFHDFALKACEKYEPQVLCIYLYQLAKEFSQFYGNCSVLKADSNEIKQARLALVVATGIVLNKGLELTGIKTAQRM